MPPLLHLFLYELGQWAPGLETLGWWAHWATEVVCWLRASAFSYSFALPLPQQFCIAGSEGQARARGSYFKKGVKE